MNIESSASSAWILGAAASGLAAAVGIWTWARQRRPDDAALPPQAPETDPVTGLPVRAAFEDALDDATHRCDSDGGALAVIYLGLDNFRMVNEAYSHAVGDRLLRQVAGRLREAAPDAISITRNAGDEFVLAVPGGQDAAQRTAACLREQIRRRFEVDGHELALDVSLGLALYPKSGSRPRLLSHAAAGHAHGEAGRWWCLRRVRVLHGREHARTGRTAARPAPGRGQRRLAAGLPAEDRRAQPAGHGSRSAVALARPPTRRGQPGDLRAGGREAWPDRRHRPLGHRGSHVARQAPGATRACACVWP